MSTSRARKVVIPFVVQAFLVGVLAAGALWTGWERLRAPPDGLVGAHRAAHQLRGELRILSRSVAKFAAREDTATRARVEGDIERAQGIVTAAGGVHTEVERAEIAQRFVAGGAAAHDVLLAPDDRARLAALDRYGEQVAAAQESIERLEDVLVASARGRLADALRGVLVALLLATGVYGVTLTWGWSAALAQARARRAEHRDGDERLARFLRDVARGDHPEDLRSATLPPPLRNAALDAADALRHARHTLDGERQRSRFSYALGDALELADTEDEICATAARAARLAFPGTTFQVLLADHAQARLEPRWADAPPICGAATPQGCPAIRRGRTVVHAPEGGMSRCPRIQEQDSHVGCSAIAVRGRTIGVVQVAGGRPLDDDLEALTSLSFALGARLGVVRTLGEREIAAATDALTGLANRRSMMDRLGELDGRGEQYALVAADLDHFKRLNDTFGHDVGDRCLRLFSQVLRDCCRATDLPCRPGGEEFTIVLAAGGIDGARALAARVHERLSEATRRAGVGFTVSLGIAARPAHGLTAEDVLRCADLALYAAKEAGRDRTEVYGETPIPPPLQLQAARSA